MKIEELNINDYGLSDRYRQEATLYPEYSLARIIAQHRGMYRIASQSGDKIAEISGRLRHEIRELAEYPACGDYVMITEDSEPAIIHKVLTRKSLFVRKAVGVNGQAQSVAANVDVVFLCMSLNRNYSLNRMERYLSIAWDSGAKPVVVLTKADLCDDIDERISEIELISCYSDVIAVSMFDDDIQSKFRKYFENNRTCAFIGSSGVGKSTLINSILGAEELDTAEIGKGDKGRHTTTGREMYPCPLGGAVIDTPGMREMGANSADLSKSFADIEQLACGCRFSDCTHSGEPGCAVQAAIERGEIDERRLESYRKLEIESGYEGLSSRELEARKLERMFKDVGGIKNAKKIAKNRNR